MINAVTLKTPSLNHLVSISRRGRASRRIMAKALAVTNRDLGRSGRAGVVLCVPTMSDSRGQEKNLTGHRKRYTLISGSPVGHGTLEHIRPDHF